MGHRTRPLEALARMVWQRFDEDHCLPIASSLAFTALLALVPIITVALTLMSAFPVFKAASAQFEAFLLSNLIPEAAASIATYTRQLTENAGRLTVIGLVVLFVMAAIVLSTIDRAFNRIWRVTRPPRAARRLAVYAVLLGAGPLLIGLSLSLTSWFVSASLGVVKDVPYAVLVLLRVVPIVLTGFAFTLLYVTLPNRRVLLRDALTGGFLAALVFEAMKHGFALYITRIPTYTLVYGAFAAIPIFLIWIYLSWVVVLIGAVTAAVLPDWRERADQAEPPAGSQFLDALQILRVLRDARNADERVDERRLHGILKRPVDRIEAMLDEMKAAGWIERGRRGWQLARDLSGITVADIYHRFVFRGDIRLPARESGEALDRSALELAERLHEKLALPVEALFDSPPVS